MYLAIIVLPLLGSIVSGFFNRKVGIKGSHLITCSFLIATTMLAVTTFMEVGFNNLPVSIHLFRWIDSESLNILWGLISVCKSLFLFFSFTFLALFNYSFYYLNLFVNNNTDSLLALSISSSFIFFMLLGILFNILKKKKIEKKSFKLTVKSLWYKIKYYLRIVSGEPWIVFTLILINIMFTLPIRYYFTSNLILSEIPFIDFNIVLFICYIPAFLINKYAIFTYYNLRKKHIKIKVDLNLEFINIESISIYMIFVNIAYSIRIFILTYFINCQINLHEILSIICGIIMISLGPAIIKYSKNTRQRYPDKDILHSGDYITMGIAAGVSIMLIPDSQADLVEITEDNLYIGRSHKPDFRGLESNSLIYLGKKNVQWLCDTKTEHVCAKALRSEDIYLFKYKKQKFLYYDFSKAYYFKHPTFNVVKLVDRLATMSLIDEQTYHNKPELFSKRPNILSKKTQFAIKFPIHALNDPSIYFTVIITQFVFGISYMANEVALDNFVLTDSNKNFLEFILNYLRKNDTYIDHIKKTIDKDIEYLLKDPKYPYIYSYIFSIKRDLNLLLNSYKSAEEKLLLDYGAIERYTILNNYLLAEENSRVFSLDTYGYRTINTPVFINKYINISERDPEPIFNDNEMIEKWNAGLDTNLHDILPSNFKISRCNNINEIISKKHIFLIENVDEVVKGDYLIYGPTKRKVPVFIPRIEPPIIVTPSELISQLLPITKWEFEVLDKFKSRINYLNEFSIIYKYISYDSACELLTSKYKIPEIYLNYDTGCTDNPHFWAINFLNSKGAEKKNVLPFTLKDLNESISQSTAKPFSLYVAMDILNKGEKDIDFFSSKARTFTIWFDLLKRKISNDSTKILWEINSSSLIPLKRKL